MRGIIEHLECVINDTLLMFVWLRVKCTCSVLQNTVSEMNVDGTLIPELVNQD